MKYEFEIRTYKFEIKTDWDFYIKYYGRKSSSNIEGNYFSILFQSISETFNSEKILETLENIELICCNEDDFKLFQIYFEEIKNEIKKGNTNFKNNYFTFSIIEQDADDVVYI